MKVSTSQPKIHMVDLQTQYERIRPQVEAGFAEVIAKAAFIGGPPVRAFAANLADYLGVKHVIPCGNGTDALQIAMMALDLQPGDEVITVPFTFVATAEVCALLGLQLKFVDIDPETFVMDPKALEAAITEKTKCIVPVHLYGQAANMEAINAVANVRGIPVIEDNAQAIGANVKLGDKWVKTGAAGTIGCTSFYPSKNLGAYGDGGAIFTNDDALGLKIKAIANHGQKEKYKSEWVGVNSRLDSFQAVVLNAKLELLDKFSEERQAVAAFYDAKFESHPKLTIPVRAPWSTHVFHQYTLIYSGDRDALRERLSEQGIPSMVYYPIPIHQMPAYQKLNVQVGDLSQSEQLAKQVISLPMHTELKSEHLEYIAETVLRLC